jgi:hypothetical protein
VVELPHEPVAPYELIEEIGRKRIDGTHINARVFGELDPDFGEGLQFAIP